MINQLDKKQKQSEKVAKNEKAIIFVWALILGSSTLHSGLALHTTRMLNCYLLVFLSF